MSRFFSNKFKNLEPYTPGEQPQERKYIKLNTNESPFAPSKRAQDFAKKELSKVMLYPDPENKRLNDTFAALLGVKSSQLLFTNGSDEILNFAFMAYCDENTPAVFPDITYGFYSVFSEINSVPYREIPLKDDFTIDISNYFDAKGTIFIANPNAPTGILLPLSDIEKILKANPDNIVVIDEAYIDFGGVSAISLIDKYDNLIVTGTFSKSRSMAGARLGFGVANEALIADLNAIKYSTNPYNINRTTQMLGLGTVLFDSYTKKNCKKIIKTREYTENALKKLGFTMTKSYANFVFAKSDKISGKDLYIKLKNSGILVRHFDKERICDYNRITIGSKKQMSIFIKAVKRILEELK